MAWTVVAMIFAMGIAIELGMAKAPQLQFKSMARASLPRFKSIVEAPQPQFRQIAGSPEPTDFGCTTTFDAVDLCSMDNKYYYFMGSYLYTIEKFSSNITGPRAVSDFFSGLTLPVIAAFSTGPLNPLMFIIDSSASSNLKVYKFNSASAYPRLPLQTASVAAVLRSSSSLTKLVTAVMAISSPARVYVFGKSSTSSAASFTYNTGASVTNMFTYVGEVQTGWNASVTGASMWYNMSSGVTKNFLYDNTGKVALVSTTLAIVPPGDPTALSSCPSWVPPQMNGCCTAKSNANATSQISTTSASTSSVVTGSSASVASTAPATGVSTPASTTSVVTGSSASVASTAAGTGASSPASTNSGVTGSLASVASTAAEAGASTSAASSSTAAANTSIFAPSSSTQNEALTAASSSSPVTNAFTSASIGSTARGSSTPPVI